MDLEIVKQAAISGMEQPSQSKQPANDYAKLEQKGFAVPTKTHPLPAKQLTPDQKFQQELKKWEQWGETQGTRDWWNPLDWFAYKAPDWVTEPASKDPRQLQIQQAALRGYQRAQKNDTHLISEMQADLAAKADNTVGNPRVWEWIAGNLGMEGNSDTWAGTRKRNDYARGFINEEADMLQNPYTSQSMAVLQNAANRVGKTFYTAEQLDKNFHKQMSGNGNLSGWGNTTGWLEDAANSLVYQNAFLNWAAVAGGGALAGSSGMSAMPVAARVGIGIGTGVAPAAVTTTAGIIGDTAMGRNYEFAVGSDKGKAIEDNTRRQYGDKITNELAQQQFYGTDPNTTDEQGNPVMLQAPPNATAEEMESMLDNWQDYQKWMADQGISADMSHDEATKLGYVNYIINGGTPGTEIFNTPMFRTMSADNQVESFEAWLQKRFERDNNLLDRGISWVKNLGNKADMLAEAMRNDTTGVYADGFSKFLSNASPEMILAFMEKHSGGQGGSKDIDVVFDAVQNGFINAMKNDHTKIWPMLQGSLKLQAAMAEKDSKDPTAASRGANMIKTAFKNVLADPDSFNDMPDKDKLEVIKALAKVYSSSDGPAMLGQEGDELATKVMSNLQDQALVLAKEHPEMWPDLMGAYLMTKNMPDAAEAVSNPWVFWVGAGSLLLGGVMLLGSVLDDDDDDDEEDEDKEYDNVVRSAIARVTGKV